MTSRDQFSEIACSLERNRLLRDAEVRALTKIGKTKRGELIKQGLFPAPLQLPNGADLFGRTNYWLQGEIADFLQEQVRQRNAQIAQIAASGLNRYLTTNMSAYPKEADHA